MTRSRPRLLRALGALALSALLGAAPAVAQDRAPVPEKRFSLAEGVSLQGRDLRQILDTTLEGCAAACLADAECQAMTFNARNGVCTPKAEAGGRTAYQGAVSGIVLSAAPGAQERARTRAADLGFLEAADLRAAEAQARGLPRRHLTGFARREDVTAQLAEARAAGDGPRIYQLLGALVVLGDGAGDWTDYAAQELQSTEGGDPKLALAAAVNGYLRAPAAPEQATALLRMSEALERDGRGRAMLLALRKAKALSARADIAQALEEAEGRYGFRISEHQVEADGPEPRICAIFSEDLARSGVDYASFVQAPTASGLSVEAEGNQLCIAGLERGQRHALTFRAGLPSSEGDRLAKDVTITGYIRDRAASVSFPGRAYILPRGVDAGLPVQTVNTARIDLRLLRVSDRNLVAAMRGDYFARALDVWDLERFQDRLAEEVWTGSATVADLATEAATDAAGPDAGTQDQDAVGPGAVTQVNREVTTRLPVQEVTGALGPGVYAMVASVPGTEGYASPPALQWFVVSDLGMSSFSGVDGLTVAVRRLSDAAPVSGAEVALVSRGNEVVARVATDAEGIAHFAPELAAGRDNSAPALVSVSLGEDMSFLSLTDAEFDLSDRGVAGLPPAPPIDVFLSTDRGAYRVGETVFATVLARDATARALPGVPLTLVLSRPDGVEYSRLLAQDAGAGGGTAALPIGATAPRGTWRLDVLADPKAPPLASSKLLVEDFLPERIDLTLDLPEGVLRAGDLPVLHVAGRYLFSAPAAGLGYEGEVRFSPAAEVPGYAGFRFGRHDAAADSHYLSLGAGDTDAEGHATIALQAPEAVLSAQQPLEARLALRLREASGRPVERRLNRVVMPADPVIGIRPMFEGGLPEGANARFQIVALGADLQPVGMALRWRVNQIETRYQWYAVDGAWNWEPVTRRVRLAEGDLPAQAPQEGQEGVAPQEISVPTGWGQYELIVEPVAATTSPTTTSPAPAGTAAASVGFEAGWFASADVLASPDRLALSLDKPDYQQGDTAQLRIVAPAPGVALVSVLSNRVIALRSVAVKAGENTVALPVTAEWGAGAYVTASVLRPLGAAKAAPASRTPVRAMGLVHAPVAPGDRRLAAVFETAPTADPRARLTVALKVEGIAPGETAYATIAAVDLGILNLTGFKAPDPLAHYFGQRRLGVGLRDLYGRLIDGRSGTPGVMRSGGDAGALTMQAPPPTEELVAYFAGPLTVDADGMVRTGFDLPAFNGTVKLMAVVWSQSAIGQAEAEVLVRDPVVVTASVPRFLAPGDQSRLLLELTHTAGPAGQMALALAAQPQVASGGGGSEAPALELGSYPDTVDLPEGGRLVLEVPVRAPQQQGPQQISITLTTPDGRRLEKLLTLPVERNGPAVSRQSRFDLPAGQTFTFDANVFAGFLPGTARSVLAAGPAARLDSAAILAALDAYPYGCTEQVTSKAMPLLYLSSLAEAMDLATPGDLSARIDTAIGKVLTNQDSSGAFGLWRAGSGDGWLDAYVTDFLSRARKAGHAVPDRAFRAALDNLRNQVNYAADFDRNSNGGGRALAYQLMILAREGAAAVGDLRYYADVKAEDFATPLALAQLAAALGLYGDQPRADALFARAGQMLSSGAQERPANAVWREDFGSSLRDAAAVLTLAGEAGSTALDRAAIGTALSVRLGRGALSPQEAAWSLMAAGAAFDLPGSGGLTVDGQPVEGPLVRILDAATAGRALAVHNPGKQAEVITMTTTGVPEVPEPAGGNGWQIRRSHYTLSGEPVEIAHVVQGTRLVTVLEITPLGPQEARLVINDPLPAGYEIDNPNLLRGGDLAGLGWLDLLDTPQMAEFRQDRFLAAVDRRGEAEAQAPFRLAYMMRAVSPGRFLHPAASVEDMYRPEMRGHTATGEVVIE